SAVYVVKGPPSRPRKATRSKTNRNFHQELDERSNFRIILVPIQAPDGSYVLHTVREANQKRSSSHRTAARGDCPLDKLWTYHGRVLTPPLKQGSETQPFGPSNTIGLLAPDATH